MKRSKKLGVMQRDGFACVKCESKKELTIDHVVPKCVGGTDHWDNLQTLCFSCNQQKQRADLELKKLGFKYWKPRNPLDERDRAALSLTVGRVIAS